MAKQSQCHFLQISAVGSGVASIREAADEAIKQKTYGKKTILFIGGYDLMIDFDFKTRFITSTNRNRTFFFRWWKL